METHKNKPITCKHASCIPLCHFACWPLSLQIHFPYLSHQNLTQSNHSPHFFTLQIFNAKIHRLNSEIISLSEKSKSYKRLDDWTKQAKIQRQIIHLNKEKTNLGIFYYVTVDQIVVEKASSYTRDLILDYIVYYVLRVCVLIV